MIQLALFQPDIPQNLGALLRLSACMNVTLHIIEPCGFPLDDKRMRRVGMDYIDMAKWQRHASWPAFQTHFEKHNGRLVLMTTKASIPYTDHSFSETDYILMGRESAGVPEDVHRAANERIIIPMKEGARSLNLAMSAAIVVSEAIRQIGAAA